MNGRALLAVGLAVGVVSGLVAAAAPEGGTPADLGIDDKDHPLEWGDCRVDHDSQVDDDDDEDEEVLDAARCAELEVPVDHADPQGGTLRLSILRVPATGGEGDRVGALFVDPGGPGGRARELALEIGRRLPAVLERFDVVGVDPRGTGAGAVDCGYDVTDLFGTDPVVESEAEAAALVGANREYVAACRAEADDLLAHLGTRDAARDLDAVRAALGDEQLSYLGSGPGTVLGQAYAQMFPERVRAMALDAAVPLGRDGLQLVHAQAVGFQRTLTAFAQSCNAQPDCPASPDALGAVTELMLRTRQDPVPAEPRDLGAGEVETGMSLPLHDRSRWHDLATAVEAALLGNGTRLVGFADEYIDEADVDQHYAASCLDHAWPTGPGGPAELLALGAAAEAEAPHFGDSVASHYLPCTMWPVAAEPLTPPAGPAPPGSTPVLVVATTGDPAAPYDGGVALAQQLGGVLLTHHGEAHTIVGQGLDCVDDAVADYLVDLELPSPGATCAALP